MSSPFVGEIRMFGGSYAPRDWLFCAGQILPISSYEVLYAVIGTTYGGNGSTTFAVPDMRGRVPVHRGTGPGLTPRSMGQTYGSPTVTLLPGQIPNHAHTLAGTNNPATATTPGGNVFAAMEHNNYGSPTPTAPASAMQGNPVQQSGGGQEHDNMMPSLVLNFIICSYGIFPSQN